MQHLCALECQLTFESSTSSVTGLAPARMRPPAVSCCVCWPLKACNKLLHPRCVCLCLQLAALRVCCCRTIYNMCTQKPPYDYSEQLYQRYKDAFNTYINDMVSNSSSRGVHWQTQGLCCIELLGSTRQLPLRS